MKSITRLKDEEREAAGKCRARVWCSRPALFIASYDYPHPVRPGQWSVRRSPYCEKHAQGFADRHNMELPPGVVA